MTWNLENQATTPTFKNPKTIRVLKFVDRLNTQYIVEDQPIEELIIGYTKTYKDYIQQGLDPNVEQNKNVYGIAKTLDPLTVRINRMKDSINGANMGYYSLLKEKQEQEQKKNESQEQPVNTPKEEVPNGVPNTTA